MPPNLYRALYTDKPQDNLNSASDGLLPRVLELLLDQRLHAAAVLVLVGQGLRHLPVLRQHRRRQGQALVQPARLHRLLAVVAL